MAAVRMTAVVWVTEFGTSRRFSWASEYRNSSCDSYDIFDNCSGPDHVALLRHVQVLVLVEWYGRSQGEECTGGEDVVDKHSVGEEGYLWVG